MCHDGVVGQCVNLGYKKLVNKLHSVGFFTSLWLGVTQWITNEISNFVTF